MCWDHTEYVGIINFLPHFYHCLPTLTTFLRHLPLFTTFITLPIFTTFNTITTFTFSYLPLSHLSVFTTLPLFAHVCHFYHFTTFTTLCLLLPHFTVTTFCQFTTFYNLYNFCHSTFTTRLSYNAITFFWHRLFFSWLLDNTEQQFSFSGYKNE